MPQRRIGAPLAWRGLPNHKCRLLATQPVVSPVFLWLRRGLRFCLEGETMSPWSAEMITNSSGALSDAIIAQRVPARYWREASGFSYKGLVSHLTPA